MPKSRSGPVRVIRTFEPQLETDEQRHLRLLQHLALVEDRIAKRETFLFDDPIEATTNSRQLQRLYDKRKDLENALSRFGE